MPRMKIPLAVKVDAADYLRKNRDLVATKRLGDIQAMLTSVTGTNFTPAITRRLLNDLEIPYDRQAPRGSGVAARVDQLHDSLCWTRAEVGIIVDQVAKLSRELGSSMTPDFMSLVSDVTKLKARRKNDPPNDAANGRSTRPAANAAGGTHRR